MKYKIKNLIIDADSPQEALKLSKNIFYNTSSIVSIFDASEERKKLLKNLEEAKKELKTLENRPDAKSIPFQNFEYYKNKIKKIEQKLSVIKDSATANETLAALVVDEEAAADAYDIAIANLIGNVKPEVIDVLRAIRNDERKHIENLYAAINGTIEQKNLEDALGYGVKFESINFGSISGPNSLAYQIASKYATSKNGKQLSFSSSSDLAKAITEIKESVSGNSAIFSVQSNKYGNAYMVTAKEFNL